MIEFNYKLAHLGLYLREDPGASPWGRGPFVDWLKFYGAEYIYDGFDATARIRFENDEDATVFKLKFGL